MLPNNNIKISLEKVSFAYDKELILDQIDLNIEEGSFVCLLGPSGCGKSTLLSLLEGLNFPTEGHIKIDGNDIKAPGLDRSVVFQDYSLFPWMSTGDNILLAMKQAFKGVTKKELKKRANSYLEMVGLKNVYDKLPKELSGGMRQRAAIARAFSIGSPILLMDEPFGALDAITRSTLQELLINLWNGKPNEKKKTVVFVTHDVEEALLLATRIIVLGQGHVVMDAPVEYSEEVRIKEFFFKTENIIGLRDRILHVLNNQEETINWTYTI